MGAKNAQRTAKDHHYSFLPFLPTGLLAPASNASLKGRQVAYFFLLFATHYSPLITHCLMLIAYCSSSLTSPLPCFLRTPAGAFA
jgi:hypothetical protein